MQIVCPKCGRPVDGADIDIASRLAVCRPCSEVLPLDHPPQTASLALRVPDGLFRPTDLPWVEKRRGERAWRVSIRPPPGLAIRQLVFAVLWTGFMLSFVLLMRGPAHFFAITLLPFVGFGFFVGYLGLAGLNRMVVDINHDMVTATRAPVPELGGVVREPTVNVVGFSPTSHPISSRGGAQMRWRLHVLTRDGRAIPIRVNLTEGAHATYAAERLTQMLAEARQGHVPYRE